ncbi:MAG TPA: carboxypeptidase regulatory-like domain-containing protein, partial [Gemmatimonadaceae bacterium]|nr:carboxypeptidase regulatory-like domain-containing protein [Gemmatimonadaceae bacterium]
MHSTIRRLAAFALGLGIAIPSALLSQDVPGRVTGRVTDERSGAPLSNVGVQIVGTGQGTMTREDGEYSVANVRPGTVTIQLRRIGYQPKTVTGLMLAPGGLLAQDVVLVPATIQLETQRIVATARGSVNEALEKQKNAAGVQNSITQEEMSKTADGDAAQAVQRVSGVTVEGGRYVSVRGLNERYTTTSLNGARIPSPEPEKKVVPLDLFPSGLLQAVTTAKTFTPDLPGDFAGAAVDLQTREFPLTPVRAYSLSAGVNTSVVGKDMLSAPTTGGEWAALTGSSRSMPGPIAGAGRFTRSYSTSEMNALVGSFRNAWAAERKNGAPNVSASASIGGRDSVFGHGFGYIGSLTYSLSNEVRRDEYRARAVPSGPSGLIPVNAYRGETGRSSVLWGGLFNFSTLLGRTKLDFNNVYTRTADNDARVDSGTFTADELDIQRTVLRYVERSALSSQVRLERAIGERQLLKGAVTGALVTRDEPDRSELVYGYELDPVTGARSGLRWQQAYSDAARRSFGTLDENDFSGTADYRIDVGNLDRPLSLKVGVYGRRTRREADANAFSIFGSLDNTQRELSPEQIFDGRFTQGSSSLLTVTPNANTGAYAATDLVGAGYAMIEAQPLSRVRVAAGARAEQSQMQLATSSLGNIDIDTTYRHFDLLPSAVVTVELTPSQNLRLAASQTLARPEYRERAPMRYYDIIEDDLIVGNPALRQSVIRNADVRWEWYPASG